MVLIPPATGGPARECCHGMTCDHALTSHVTVETTRGSSTQVAYASSISSPARKARRARNPSTRTVGSSIQYTFIQLQSNDVDVLARADPVSGTYSGDSGDGGSQSARPNYGSSEPGLIGVGARLLGPGVEASFSSYIASLPTIAIRSTHLISS